MLHWFKFRDNDTSAFEWLVVNSLGYRQRAVEEVIRYEVPRSDKTLSLHTGHFKSYERTMIVTFRYERELTELYKWLRGSGRLETSIDHGVFFNASILEVTPPEHLGAWLFQIEITFLVDGLAYMHVGEEPVEIEQETLFVNPGTWIAKPTVKLWGTGGIITAGDYRMELKEINEYIEVDCDRMITTKDGIPQGEKVIGDFLKLPVGEFTVSLGEGLQKAELKPRWCRQ